MVPAMLGSLLLLNLKVFGKKKEMTGKTQKPAEEIASV
jgi:hypothetical protein